MIKTRLDNPTGLHKRYHIQKIVGEVISRNYTESVVKETSELVLQDVDEGAEYFVLRLDDGGSDPIHIEACRNAALYYAGLIKDHIPLLSKDLIRRYGHHQQITGRMNVSYFTVEPTDPHLEHAGLGMSHFDVIISPVPGQEENNGEIIFIEGDEILLSGTGDFVISLIVIERQSGSHYRVRYKTRDIEAYVPKEYLDGVTQFAHLR